MTKDEAILINNKLIKKAKSIGDTGLPKEWQWSRCDLCTFQIVEGEKYISFTPAAYKDRRKAFSGLTHVDCLDFHDRTSYPYSTKTAVNGKSTLLTSNWIY